MPLLLLVAGLVLIITAIRGTTGIFAGRLADDVSGGFLKWLAAIVVIGVLGYVPGLRSPSRYLLGLVALVILLTNGSGFISSFVRQIENPGAVTPPSTAGGNPQLPAIPISTGSGGGSGGGGTPGNTPASGNPLQSFLGPIASLGGFL